MTDILDAGQILTQIAVADIRAAESNDRKDFDPTELWALAESIADIGLVQAVTVRPTPAGPTPYQLVAGERRWRAIQLDPCAHLPTIKAIVDFTMTDSEADAVMLAENTGRVDLSVMEEARAYGKRRDDGLTVEEIARQAGVPAFRVQWRLDQLLLCPEAQEALDSGVLPSACALELRRLNADHQVAALKAWMANPTMGHLPFKRKCIQWAEQANAAVQTGLFALDTDQWAAEAAAVKPAVNSAPVLRKMIAQLLAQMADHRHLLCAEGDTPLMEEARAMIGQ